MPYLDEEQRANLDYEWLKLADKIATPGQLNYAICKLTERAVLQQFDLSYHTLSKFHAAMQDAADEFQRRVIDVYEDKVRVRNGDVFTEIIGNICEKFNKEERR